MKNYAQEVNQTSDSQSYHHLQSFHLPFFYSEPFLSSTIINYPSSPTFETSQSLYQNFKVDQSFTRRTKTNIVLSAQSQQKAIKPKLFLGFRTKEKKGGEKKVTAKPAQKESRNVYSNILRIFFKCLLQSGTYDTLIQKAILKLNFSITKEQFCCWLLSFNINFKNYIRGTQIKKLLAVVGCFQHKKILLILLRDYLYKHAVSHCLTSKRIELSSLKMHLSGLKDLYQEIIEMKRQLL